MVMRRRHWSPRLIALGLGAGVVTTLGVAAGLEGLTGTSRVALLFLAAACAGGVTVTEAVSQRRDERNLKPTIPIAQGVVHGELFHLPRDISDFVGREADVSSAIEFLGRPRETEAVPIAVIAGIGGVGKTAFAIHVAHRLRDRFPDGQLFVDLRGADAAPLDVRDVLAGLLRELGVARPAVPESLEERSRLYRARMSRQRMLVVLDDAADEAQVRPLLPGGPGCAVIATRRVPLVGIAGTLQVMLDQLDEAQATSLLEKVIGTDRVAREPGPTADILQMCGYLPLAVRIVGNKLVSRRHWTMALFADRLRDKRRRLVELAVGDLEVRATFALSYDGLSLLEQRLFRLLGGLEVQDFAGWVGAAIIDLDLETAERLIERLVDMQLLEATSVPRLTTSETRYSFHTLLQVFARERLEKEEPPESYRQALADALAAYIAITEHAYSLAELGDLDHGIRPPSRWISDNHHDIDAHIGDVTMWFTSERANLIAIAEQGYKAGLHEQVCRLAISLYGSFNVGAHWHAWQRLYTLALYSARQCEDPRYEAEILLRLGDVYKNSGRVDGPGGIPEPDREDIVAANWLEQSRQAFAQIGDRRAEVAVMRRLGGVYRDLGYFERAESCYMQALAQAETIRDGNILRAYVMRGYGCLQRMTGRYDSAVVSYEDTISTFTQAADQRGMLGTFRGLGGAYLLLHQWEKAEECFRNHLEMDIRLKDRHGEAHMLCGLGEVRLGQGRYREAVNYFRACLPIFYELQHRSSEAETLSSLGAALLALGRRQEACSALESSRNLYRLLHLAPNSDHVSSMLSDARKTSVVRLLMRRIMN